MTVSQSIILQTEGLTKSYRHHGQELTVLRDVTLTVAAGETCAVAGPSGSGKTTLLGLCAGLDLPTAGTVVLDGRRLDILSEEERTQLRGRLLGFVFQTFHLIPTLTALENVMVPLELRGERGAEQRARDLLERVGLGARTAHYPVELSGGEQQRVAIARGFVHQPKILFADEPTGNLDGETAGQIVELLFELNRERGTTLLLVTHDLDLTKRTQRTLRLKNGRLADD